jgi:hypothetical protein
MRSKPENRVCRRRSKTNGRKRKGMGKADECQGQDTLRGPNGRMKYPIFVVKQKRKIPVIVIRLLLIYPHDTKNSLDSHPKISFDDSNLHEVEVGRTCGAMEW